MKVLITGANRGLGLSLVEKFLEEGHMVFAGVRNLNNISKLEALREDQRLHILKLDVSLEEDILKAASFIGEKVGLLDIVINNAGILLEREKLITEQDNKLTERTFKVNTLGPILINNVMLPLIEKSRQATIINIVSETSSIDGVEIDFGPYVLSKTALTQYSYILKKTFKEQNKSIRVFGIHPGRLHTDMGAENGQIEPMESAEGIYKIAVGEKLKNNESIYIDYLGENMIRN